MVSAWWYIASAIGLIVACLCIWNLLQNEGIREWDEREARQQARKAARTTRIRQSVAHPERFTAVAMCPYCEKIAVHRIRAPKPLPDRIAATSGRRRADYCHAYGVTDETRYEVIRICDCGHTWGQI